MLSVTNSCGDISYLETSVTLIEWWRVYQYEKLEWSYEGTKQNYSFDIVSTLKDIFRNWFIVLIVGIVAGMGSFIVVTQMYKPQYSASITLLVQSKTNSQNVYDSLTATTKLAGVFKNILDSSQLQNAAAESLGYSQFPGTLSCSIVEETNILSFSVKSDSPIKSYRLLNAVLDSYPQFTKM